MIGKEQQFVISPTLQQETVGKEVLPDHGERRVLGPGTTVRLYANGALSLADPEVFPGKLLFKGIEDKSSRIIGDVSSNEPDSRHILGGLNDIFKAIEESISSEPEQELSPQLSPRQLEVIACIAEGKSNKEIGQALGISKITVNHHVAAIFTRLGVHDRTLAMTKAMSIGYVPLPESAETTPNGSLHRRKLR